MNTNTIIIITSLVSALGLAYTGFKKTNSDSKSTSITGEITLSNGWKEYAQKLETRLDLMESKFDELHASFEKLSTSYLKLQQEMEVMRGDNTRLTEDNVAKIGRITVLEKQVIDLQNQLDNYSHIDIDKVNEAKASLHDDVEINLNNLKQ